MANRLWPGGGGWPLWKEHGQPSGCAWSGGEGRLQDLGGGITVSVDISAKSIGELKTRLNSVT